MTILNSFNCIMSIDWIPNRLLFFQLQISEIYNKKTWFWISIFSMIFIAELIQNKKEFFEQFLYLNSLQFFQLEQKKKLYFIFILFYCSFFSLFFVIFWLFWKKNSFHSFWLFQTTKLEQKVSKLFQKH